MNPILSIIVPIFNVERYLDECVQSILCQRNDEIEIILVDDGSKDNSGLIADSYKNDFIRVIHKENGGLASARNAGLEVATGDYVAFIDSDDRVSPNAITKLLDWLKLNSFDICFMQAFKFYPDGSIEDLGDNIHSNDLHNKSKEDAVKYLTTRPKFPGSACTKIYNRLFLQHNNLFFPKDRRLSEDLGFIRDCIRLAKIYDALDFCYYEYRQSRDGSITSRSNQKSVEGLQLFIKESVDTLCIGRKPISTIERRLMSYVAYEFSVLMLNAANFNMYGLDFLRSYKWVLKYASTCKIKLIRICSILIGIKATSSLIARFKN